MKSKKKLSVAKAADTTVNTTLGIFGSIMKVLVTVLLIFITTGLLFTCVFAFYVKTCMTENLDVSLSDFNLAESSVILYKDTNDEWQELVTLSSQENRTWADYADIPRIMEYALVSVEDQRFYTHKGVDWYRTAGAFVNMFLGMKSDFGGSTITQQLIKNLTKFDEATVQRKLLEIFRALEFEKKNDKKDIIEWYLNAVYFGEGSWGVVAAAKTYYGKELSELSLAECASIVGITNNPSKYSPFSSLERNKERQEIVLRCMYEQGYIEYDEYVEAVNEKLVPVRSENEAYEQEIYPYYVESILDDVLQDFMDQRGINLETAENLLYRGGYRIYSCMDISIQNQVDAVYKHPDQIPQPYITSDQQLQSAIVIMDPYTGDIVAMSGGVGEKTVNLGTNRATDSQRPPGSSIKPLSVYGPAYEYGLITQNTLVNDAGPDEIQLSKTSWYPRNAGGGYDHIVNIRWALRRSLNTVAAQIIDKLGVSASYDYLTQKLGITSLVSDDRDYAPLALGQLTNGITVREMSQAFSSFVNEGIFTESRTYTLVTDSSGRTVLENPAQTHVAWTANTAYNILNMLENAVSSGTGTEAYLGTMPVAGKTGTSSNNWDRWFVGMTPYYVAAVWTGYDINEPMHISGNPAAQIWKKIMGPIHDGLEYKSFPWPYIGGDTHLFGDLTEALEEQNNPSPTPSPTPEESTEPSESPTTDVPPPSEPVEPSDPVEPIDPVEPEPPDPTNPIDGGFQG